MIPCPYSPWLGMALQSLVRGGLTVPGWQNDSVPAVFQTHCRMNGEGYRELLRGSGLVPFARGLS